ncbi:MAG: zf-HC2 domain-containing protein [Planctomycetota bacterium]|nr:zf-HC2 domain-containing protein [Planctomycetota bacterium]
MRHAGDHVSSRGLSTLLDGELDLLEAREARIHIATCAECRDRLEEIEEIGCRIVLAGREGRPRPGLEPGILGMIRESKRASRQRRKTRLTRWSWPVAAAAALTVLIAGLAGRDPIAVIRQSALSELTHRVAPPRVADQPPPAPRPAAIPAPSLPETPTRAPVHHPSIEFVVRTRQTPEPEIQFVVNLGTAPVVEEEERGRADPVDGPSRSTREELLWGALATAPLTSKIVFREPEPSMRRREPEWLRPSEARQDVLVSVKFVAAQWQ